ncbi:TonB-dependent receptor domain-containing protein [Spongiibacter sp. UBA1325]|jgi:outer membrane receptor protein involved in Fe transport|uniref:TonB-dependent receptor domain-containing protein n=1 Tax=Spongiibacter sp. UBA1325 TaxID=1947543 RepID=UPI00257FD07A|nr:TonB-dependent receptor [Spongiibacter sp. UBA1325]|tara:strand:- start:3556 stop:5025 length:1470 start_codon:yes stop_codon:yes gene_type:complete
MIRRETHQDDGAFANSDSRAEHSERYFPDVLDSRTDILVFSADWSFEAAELKLILSNMEKDYPQRLDYSQFIGTSTVGVGLYGDTVIESSQPTAEVRLVSTQPTESTWWLLDEWSYVAGYFYVYSDQYLQLSLGTESTGDVLTLTGDVDAEENAVFFDLNKPLGQNWELGIGARIFRQSTDADIRTDVVLVDNLLGILPLPSELLLPVDIGPISPGGAIQLGREKGRIAETVFNPKLTLLWRASDSISLFTSAVKGFRYAGANQNPTLDPGVPLFFDSDSIWNYELGIRTTWLEGALQVDLTAFYLEWTDMQVQQREYTGAFAYTDNVGGAENKGLEFSMNALLPWGFSTKLNLSYVDAKTTEFFDDFQGPAPAGTELPGSPPYSGSFILLWLGRLSSAELTSTLSYTWQNRNYNNLPQTYEHPAISLLGASLNARFLSLPGKPFVSLTGSNLTNEFKPGVVFDTPNTGGILTIYNPPRSVKLGIEFSL